MLGSTSEVAGGDVTLTAATNITLNGKLSASQTLVATAANAFTNSTTSEIFGGSLNITANTITLNNLINATNDLTVTATDDLISQGVLVAGNTLTLNAGSGGYLNSGSASAQIVNISSDSTIGNTGTISAGDQMTLQAATTITNVAALISGNDMALYADQILKNGGVIWANDDIVLAANDNLDRASLVQNTGGRIEAFQGDLTIRADEVANLGTAPTIEASEIIKWVETATAGPVDAVAQISRLIDSAYLDANGNI